MKISLSRRSERDDRLCCAPLDIDYVTEMPLLTLQDAELAYGDFPLLDRASLSLEAGERLGLIGRNGTGKSSLLGVIAGRIPLDDGELRRREGLSIALVEQEPALPGAPTLKQSLLARVDVPVGVHRADHCLYQEAPWIVGAERPRDDVASPLVHRGDTNIVRKPARRLHR
jgi:energy-coupling factor transporter ATP-binding protein EcfA2